MVGDRSLGGLLGYEMSAWLGWIPGALGLVLRKMLWPYVLGSCGKGVQFGANVRLIHPRRIHLGDRVVIGDGCVLDARNPESERVLGLGDDVMLSHGVMLSAKGGVISVGARCGLGAYTVVHSSKGNPVTIGTDTAVGAGSYITGGGEYSMDRLTIPIWKQGARVMGGTTVEDGVWLGAHAVVLGGATVGANSVVGAGSVVKGSIPAASVCAGVPARVLRMREPAADTRVGTTSRRPAD